MEDSIAEAQTRDKTPRSISGQEAERLLDSLLADVLKRSGLDSATYFDIPPGHARVTEPDGTSYIRKLTPEEIEEQRKDPYLQRLAASGDIIAYDLDGKRVGKAGYREQGKPYVINTEGLQPGTYMLSIPGEKQMKKIVVQ